MSYYGAHNYSPAISRWLSVDPLADKYPAYSPYNYVLGNPLGMRDPDGNAPVKCPPCSLSDQLYKGFGGPLLDNMWGKSSSTARHVRDNPDRVLHAVGETARRYGDASDAATLGLLGASLVPGLQEVTLPAAGVTSTVGLIADMTAVSAFTLEASLFTKDYGDATRAGRDLVVSEITGGLINRAASEVILPAPSGKGSKYRWGSNFGPGRRAGQFAPSKVGLGLEVSRDATSVVLPGAINEQWGDD